MGGHYSNDKHHATDNVELLDTLTSANVGTVAAIFNTLAANHAELFKPYEPALQKLQQQIEIMQAANVHGVSLQLADSDTFRHYGIMRGDLTYTPYFVLAIDDAALMIRINADVSIDVHANNINKVQPSLRKLSELFDNTQRTVVKGVPVDNFLHYDLSRDEECLAFIKSTLQSAAFCKAYSGLKKYNTAGNDGIYGPIKKLRK